MDIICSFKIFTVSKHVPVMKICHKYYSLLHSNWRFSNTYCTLSHSEFFTNISSGDWPVYEVTHASSCIRKWLIYQGQYFFWFLQWGCYCCHILICMVKTIVHTLCFTLTEPRLNYGWVVEKHTFSAILLGLFN